MYMRSNAGLAGFAGYRARRPRRRGLGAAACPSLQQLQGITDPMDPCQQLSPGGDTVGNFPGQMLDTQPQPAPNTAPPTCMPGDQLTSQGGYWVCVPPSSSDISILGFKISPAVALGGMALVLFLVAQGGSRR